MSEIELAELLEGSLPLLGTPVASLIRDSNPDSPPPSPAPASDLIQWSVRSQGIFTPSARVEDRLPPGVYRVDCDPNLGIFFQLRDIRTESLLRFPETNIDRVVEEIQTFWDRGEIFEEYGLAHKRGILLWGPPGGGKSCTTQLIMKDIIDRGGVCFEFSGPFDAGFRIFRQIEPETPVVVLMEDIDSIITDYNESWFLNILDGYEAREKVVFLATTNYPERLGARIVNRPSRFDRRYKIGLPNPESRHLYLEHISDGTEIDIEQWVSDTEEFSLAHLRELFVATIILGNDYEESLNILRNMKENISSLKSEMKMGFKTKEVL